MCIEALLPGTDSVSPADGKHRIILGFFFWNQRMLRVVMDL